MDCHSPLPLPHALAHFELFMKNCFKNKIFLKNHCIVVHQYRYRQYVFSAKITQFCDNSIEKLLDFSSPMLPSCMITINTMHAPFARNYYRVSPRFQLACLYSFIQNESKSNGIFLLLCRFPHALRLWCTQDINSQKVIFYNKKACSYVFQTITLKLYFLTLEMVQPFGQCFTKLEKFFSRLELSTHTCCRRTRKAMQSLFFFLVVHFLGCYCTTPNVFVTILMYKICNLEKLEKLL